MEKPSSYLSIDPGDTLGWAEFDDRGNVQGFGQESDVNFTEFITDKLHSGLKAVIVEKYVVFQKKALAHSGSDMKTSKMIGKIELLADMRKVPVILQPSSIYPIGAKWGGFDIPRNHSISHQYVAVAHGIYYLQQSGVRAVGQAMMRKDTNENS